MTAKAKTRERKETEWIVLEAVEGVIGDPQDGETVEAWRVLGIHVSRSKAEALDAIAGEKTGKFKGVPATAWRGGRSKVQETLVTSKPIDD